MVSMRILTKIAAFAKTISEVTEVDLQYDPAERFGLRSATEYAVSRIPFCKLSVARMHSPITMDGSDKTAFFERREDPLVPKRETEI